MNKPVRHMREEADIGSGEKNPGQHDTEKLIEQVANKEQQPRPAPDQNQQNSNIKKPG